MSVLLYTYHKNNTVMTKKEVKFVRYEASEGMSLAMTLK